MRYHGHWKEVTGLWRLYKRLQWWGKQLAREMIPTEIERQKKRKFSYGLEKFLHKALLIHVIIVCQWLETQPTLFRENSPFCP